MLGGEGWGLCASPWVPEDSGNVLGWGPARGWRWAPKMEGGAGPPGDVWVHLRPGLGERPPGACSPWAPSGLVSPAGPSCTPSSRAGRVGAPWWPGAGPGVPRGGRGPWTSASVALPRSGSLGSSVKWAATWLCEIPGSLASGGPAPWLPVGAGSRAGPTLHFGSCRLQDTPGTGFCLRHCVVCGDRAGPQVGSHWGIPGPGPFCTRQSNAGHITCSGILLAWRGRGGLPFSRGPAFPITVGAPCSFKVC